MWLILLFLLLPQITLAQTEKTPGHMLVELLGGYQQVMQINQELIETILIANPEFAPYQETISAWTNQYITKDAVEQRLAEMYSQFFTDEELNQMISYYRSETGKKAVMLTPTLLRETRTIGKQLVDDHQDALRKMLEQQQ